jgi:hypothetical protein
MKQLWNALAVMAIANLIAVVSFLGWLALGGRVSPERVQKVRAMFTETVDQEAERLAQAQAEAEAQAAEQEAQAKRQAGAPIGAMEALDLRIQRNADEEQRLERVRKEIAQLQESLAREQRKIDASLLQLEQERAAFTTERARIRELEGSKQFKKAVSVLEGLEAADAARTLDELLRNGEQDQVVAYLNAMQDRKRNAIITEVIATGQTDVAADLLERIRVRGIEISAAGVDPG